MFWRGRICAGNEWGFLRRPPRKIFKRSGWSPVFSEKCLGLLLLGAIGIRIGVWMGCCPPEQHFMEQLKCCQVEFRARARDWCANTPEITLQWHWAMGPRLLDNFYILIVEVSEWRVNVREDFLRIKISCWVKQVGSSTLHWHQQWVNI